MIFQLWLAFGMVLPVHDVIITGASRGIGAALAEAVARAGRRVRLVARTGPALETTAARVGAEGAEAEVVVGDLGSVAAARDLGERLVAQGAGKETVLVHNAGVWPSRLEVGDDGLERSFVVNFLGPWAMQQPLLEAGVRRIFVVSAGLLIKGRYDPRRTPSGEDFSAFRTYCTTKLCFAIASRELGRRNERLDVAVVHPGVVRTDLGARSGALGWLLARLKRTWEAPEDCGARLAHQLERDPWSPPGQPGWWVENASEPWPEMTESPELIDAISGTLKQRRLENT